MYTPSSKKLSWIGVAIAVIAAYFSMFIIERDVLHNPDTFVSIIVFIAAVAVFIMAVLNRYKFGGRLVLTIIFIITTERLLKSLRIRIIF
jgi:hypothetical protein